MTKIFNVELHQIAPAFGGLVVVKEAWKNYGAVLVDASSPLAPAKGMDVRAYRRWLHTQLKSTEPNAARRYFHRALERLVADGKIVLVTHKSLGLLAYAKVVQSALGYYANVLTIDDTDTIN